MAERLALIPIPAATDLGEEQGPEFKYGVPKHNLPNGNQCPNGSGTLILEEGQLKEEPTGIGNWTCPEPECGLELSGVIRDSSTQTVLQ